MSSTERRTEELLDRLLLEIKAVVLLHGTDAELREKLEAKLLDSHDESLRRFVSVMQVKRNPETGRLLVMALGELILASILVVFGTVALVPAAVGISTPAGLVQYFMERVSGAVASSPLSPYITFVEFALGVVLMLSAFFSLRESALNLKAAGLAIKSGET